MDADDMANIKNDGFNQHSKKEGSVKNTTLNKPVTQQEAAENLPDNYRQVVEARMLNQLPLSDSMRDFIHTQSINVPVALREIAEYKKAVVDGDRQPAEADAQPVAVPTVIPSDLLAPYEWVIDQFMYNGTFCIAGTHGVGKTSSLLPLSMVAAGAIEFPGIKATLKRDIIYVAEDVDQCYRIIHGMVEECGADEAIIREHVHILQAKRKTAGEHDDIRRFAEGRYRANECPAGVKAVAPLVVLDTTSANLKVENASENSQVSDTVATVRRVYRGFPLWLPTHVSKQLRRADVTDLSVIGATAWEADTQGTFFLFQDGDSGERYLYGGAPAKRRDNGTVTELRIVGTTHTESRVDAYGYTQDISFMSINLELSSEADRERLKREAKAVEQGKKEDSARIWLLAELDRCAVSRADNPSNREWYPGKEALKTAATKAQICRNSVASLVDALVESGVIASQKMTPEERILTDRKSGPASYLVKA